VPIQTKDGEAVEQIDRRRAPETRERILRATLALLAEEGTAALSNRRIAAAAEVSLGSLTYHFPSQASLLREALLLYVGEEVARLEAVAAALREREPSLEEVAADVQALIGRPSGGPGPLAELELHLQAARDPELQEASARRRPGPALERLRRPGHRSRGAPSRHRRRRIGGGYGGAVDAVARGARRRLSASASRPTSTT
jgi:AcrR family transcriptional regulator